MCGGLIFIYLKRAAGSRSQRCGRCIRCRHCPRRHSKFDSAVSTAHKVERCGLMRRIRCGETFYRSDSDRNRRNEDFVPFAPELARKDYVL